MKFSVDNNEAFIKISITEKGGLNFRYGFNIEQPAGGFDADSPLGEGIMDCVAVIAGLVYLSKEHTDELIDIGDTAIANGDFELPDEGSHEMAKFLEGLTDEQIDLLEALPKGEA
jgi:hypothetical protein